MLKYQNEMANYQITDLSDESLDPAFVAKAKELQEKITNKSLSDEEVAVIDNELCALFEELHNFEEVPDQELTELQTQNSILKGKEAASKAVTAEELQAVATEYAKFPEVIEITDVKITKIAEAANEASEADKEKVKKQAEVSQAKTLADLEAITKDYDNTIPWIVAMVQDRAKVIREEMKATEEINSKGLKEKILAQKVWSYEQLREIGVNVTGEDMIIEGVKLTRIWLFKGYEVST